MAYDRAKIKAKPQNVVFITERSLALDQAQRTWPADPDHPYSIDAFLADCDRTGWPILHVGTTAYVFSTVEVAL